MNYMDIICVCSYQMWITTICCGAGNDQSAPICVLRRSSYWNCTGILIFIIAKNSYLTYHLARVCNRLYIYILFNCYTVFKNTGEQIHFWYIFIGLDPKSAIK